jgi:hypothetical protein
MLMMTLKKQLWQECPPIWLKSHVAVSPSFHVMAMVLPASIKSLLWEEYGCFILVAYVFCPPGLMVNHPVL